MSDAYSPDATFAQILAWMNQEAANAPILRDTAQGLSDYAATTLNVNTSLQRLVEATSSRMQFGGQAATMLAAEMIRDLQPLTQMQTALSDAANQLNSLAPDIENTTQKVRDIEPRTKPTSVPVASDGTNAVYAPVDPELTEPAAVQLARSYTNALLPSQYPAATTPLTALAAMKWTGQQGSAGGPGPTRTPGPAGPGTKTGGPGAKTPGSAAPKTGAADAKTPGGTGAAATTPGGTDTATPPGDSGTGSQDPVGQGSSTDPPGIAVPPSTDTTPPSQQSPGTDLNLAGSQNPTALPLQTPQTFPTTSPTTTTQQPGTQFNPPPPATLPVAKPAPIPPTRTGPTPALKSPTGGSIDEPTFTDPAISSRNQSIVGPSGTAGPTGSTPTTSPTTAPTTSEVTTGGGTTPSTSSGQPQLASAPGAAAAAQEARGGMPYMPPMGMGGMGGSGSNSGGVRPGVADGPGGPALGGRGARQSDYAGVPDELRGRSADKQSGPPRRRKKKPVKSTASGEVLDELLWQVQHPS